MRTAQVACVVIGCLVIFAVMSNLSTEGRRKPPRLVHDTESEGKEPYAVINRIRREAEEDAESGLDLPVETWTSVPATTTSVDTPRPVRETPVVTPEVNQDVANPQNALTEDDFVAVTALNAPFYDKLKNFVGSIHKWEPQMKLVVYDIGLDEKQRKEVETWKNVELMDFDFSKYPAHVRELRNYAWKPLVMKEALEKYPVFIYTDPSVEYRQPVTVVKKQILEEGYWYVHQEGLHTNLRCCGPVLELCHRGTISALGLSADQFNDKYMCAGGMQGYRRGSKAVEEVLHPTAKCALDANCIAPPGSGIPNHRYDQCVFSLHINSRGFHCEKDERFFAYPQTVEGFKVESVEEIGPVVFHLSRGRYRHYERFVQKR